MWMRGSMYPTIEVNSLRSETAMRQRQERGGNHHKLPFRVEHVADHQGSHNANPNLRGFQRQVTQWLPELRVDPAENPPTPSLRFGESPAAQRPCLPRSIAAAPTPEFRAGFCL